jgi:hypothetical protein
MSDLVPEPDSNGSIRVVKLTNGDELVATIHEISSDKLAVFFPAKIESFYSKDNNNNIVEYIKLTNYASNMEKHQFVMNKNSILCIGMASEDLKKMYETYCITIQTDPSALLNNIPPETMGAEAGLGMLNELFNNEDFVNFVNDLIDNFEGVEVNFEDGDEDEIEGQEEGPEFPLQETIQDEAPKPQKPRKRRIMNPEPNKLPYEPNANPNSPESWSDNPNDYI